MNRRRADVEINIARCKQISISGNKTKKSATLVTIKCTSTSQLTVKPFPKSTTTIATERMMTETTANMTPNGWLRSTLLVCGVSLLVLEQVHAFPSVRTTDATFLTSATSSSTIVDASGWSLGQPRQKRRFFRDISLVTIPRGGTTSSSILEDEEQGEDHDGEEEANEVEEEDDEDEEEEEDKSEDEDEDEPAVDTSQGRVLVKVKTNLENEVVDHHVETMLRRDKNVTFVKNRVQRDLPGKIPFLAIELLLDGRPLSDETVLDDICTKLEEGIEDEDDDEDDIERDEDGNPVLTLTLNIVPTVDKKFAAELSPKLLKHYEGDVEKTLPTDTLLDAYFLNQVAMERNAQLLADPNKVLPTTNPVEMKNQAKMRKEELKSQTDPEVWEKSLQPVKKTDNLPEIRGERYRSGKGGATTSLKKNIQTFFNVDIVDAIFTFVKFLFFGFFGGKTASSRALLMLAAPMSLIIQTRPAKIWLKTAFYFLSDPPSILLTLLPAPQQTILGVSYEESYAALYGSSSSHGPSSEEEEDGEDDDDDDDDEEESEYEDDDEEEEDDE